MLEFMGCFLGVLCAALVIRLFEKLGEAPSAAPVRQDAPAVPSPRPMTETEYIESCYDAYDGEKQPSYEEYLKQWKKVNQDG